MATGAAADGFFRPIYDGCLSGFDQCVEQRPYHRNCSCALHSKSRNLCTHKLPGKNVTYPMRRAWSEGSLLVFTASNHSSPSTSLALNGVRSQLCLVDQDQDKEEERNSTRFFI
ncbi:hypothetical protein TanjilG_10792 [Lupinus angustifolius]|uniref:Uncharacterized protein n=1 Tax=Lupinus angustifolius TaxID=3871 RepID=A0A1J7H9Y5_LUPAN|nr:PREDICTED: uncharacterized protein LOC109327640 [Lupinus angustifolius]OIV97258.1 hypothetical protein TanjilG_10792 [Lupinus angustifolius]